MLIYLLLQGIYNIFDSTVVKDLIDTCLRRREGFDRLLVWNCIICLTIILITVQGNISIEYLFTSARLGWTVDKLSIYVCVNILVGIFGTIFGIKLFRHYLGIILFNVLTLFLFIIAWKCDL